MEDWKDERAETEMLKFEMDHIKKVREDREKQYRKLVEKYGSIEDKIPSVWSDYEKVGIEMAQDIAKIWNIKDSELIRVMSLIETRLAGMGKPKLGLSDHIDNAFAFAGLYPEIQRVHNIFPDGMKVSNILKVAFAREGFKYVNGGSTLTGSHFLKIVDIMEDRMEGNFLLFDNAGGKAFDVMIDLPDFPGRVRDFVSHLEKENPSWIIAYRIDGVETIGKGLSRIMS
jgi:hypothetical protein